MKNKNYITLAKKAADIQINELRKIKKIFNPVPKEKQANLYL